MYPALARFLTRIAIASSPIQQTAKIVIPSEAICFVPTPHSIAHVSRPFG
jgi:hypothetical protein